MSFFLLSTYKNKKIVINSCYAKREHNGFAYEIMFIEVFTFV